MTSPSERPAGDAPELVLGAYYSLPTWILVRHADHNNVRS
jgi:hypothetical protein